MTAAIARSMEAAGSLEIGGFTVRRLGFGALRVTGPGFFGDPPDPEHCVRLLRRVVELGVNFIDTADSYGPHVSEEMIKRALHPYPDDLLIGTKAGYIHPSPGATEAEWFALGRPEFLRMSC
jgi:pyridoxine 4-dehydrogenase